MSTLLWLALAVVVAVVGFSVWYSRKKEAGELPESLDKFDDLVESVEDKVEDVVDDVVDLFDADEEETPVVEEPAPVKKAPTKKKATKQTVDFSAMTKADLLEFAAEKKIEVKKTWTKARIINELNNGL